MLFVSNTYASFDELPQGAKVGTSSLRRKTQILKQRPDLEIIDLRGNVGTRLSNWMQVSMMQLSWPVPV